jgi:hypothetical protein
MLSFKSLLVRMVHNLKVENLLRVIQWRLDCIGFIGVNKVKVKRGYVLNYMFKTA